MELLLLGVGLAVALFTGINNGGSNIGVAFGPAVGSGTIPYATAGILMAGSVILGGVLLGPFVVDTMGHRLVDIDYMTLGTGTAILLFTGVGILFGNLRGVSVSTSETAVGAIAGLGLAVEALHWETLGVIISWWLISPLIALLISAAIGRYWYWAIRGRLQLHATAPKRLIAKILIVAVACYMGFAAGASNVANAVAPLVGSDHLTMTAGVLLGGLAMGIGGFVFGRRTMRTVGEEITDLSLEGALITMTIASTIITLLSYAGIPVSLAVTATTCVIGLGWGRAQNNGRNNHNGGFNARFSRRATVRIILTWTGSPIIAFVPAYLFFRGGVVLGLL